MDERNATPRSSDATAPYWLLRRADQAAVAAIVLVVLAVMIAGWVRQGGLDGRRIELRQVESVPPQFQVDLNSAPWHELVLLPGVGETLAMRIVESRDAEGPFADAADLLRVKGIGRATLERLRPYLAPAAESRQVAGSGANRLPEDG